MFLLNCFLVNVFFSVCDWGNWKMGLVNYCLLRGKMKIGRNFWRNYLVCVVNEGDCEFLSELGLEIRIENLGVEFYR